MTLCIGTSTGMIMLFSYPFTHMHESQNYTQTHLIGKYAIHDGPVTHLALMRQAGVLFSVGMYTLSYIYIYICICCTHVRKLTHVL